MQCREREEMRRHGDRAILWPAHQASPASIVAALGAADLLREMGHSDVMVRWVPIDDSRWPDHRPEVTAAGHPAAMQTLCDAIAHAPAPDIAAYPAGTGQTLAGAVKLARRDGESLAEAWHRLRATLRRDGHVREARLLGGSVAPMPYRRGVESRLVRSPLTRGAKSDIRSAREGWERGPAGRATPRPLTRETVERHLRGETWDYRLRSGDWGLDASHWGTARQAPTPKLGDVVLARLLTQGIMAMDGAWQPADVWSQHHTRHPPRLGWPIWTWQMPVQLLSEWPSWALDPLRHEHPVRDDRAGIGLIPGAVVEWWISEAIPVSRLLASYGPGRTVGAQDLRREMWRGIDEVEVWDE